MSGWSGRIRTYDGPIVQTTHASGTDYEWRTWDNRPKAVRYVTDNGADIGTVQGYTWRSDADNEPGPTWLVSDLAMALEWCRTPDERRVKCENIYGNPVE